jgi:hypothetical protein
MDMSFTGSHAKCERDIPSIDFNGGVNLLAARGVVLGDWSPGMNEWDWALNSLDKLVSEVPVGAGETQELKSILASVWREERLKRRSDNVLVYRLQKKFALFGRLAFSYDTSLSKADERLAGPTELSLFAAVLLLRFSRNGSMNEINSALKLVDQVLLMETTPEAELKATLILERHLLRELL